MLKLREQEATSLLNEINYNFILKITNIKIKTSIIK